MPTVEKPDLHGHSGSGWKGVDLDGTLAHYDSWIDTATIGKPIPSMVERIQAWRAQGIEVRIVTARVAPDNPDASTAREYIAHWLMKHVGEVLPITHNKDEHMWELWDDRAVQVEKNTGVAIQDKLWALQTRVGYMEARVRSLESSVRAAAMIMRNSGVSERDIPKVNEIKERDLECPACGSKDFSTCQQYGRVIGVEYGPAIMYTAIENHCHDCGEEGDFGALNDPIIEECCEISRRFREMIG